jgi:hypothetical protein
MGRLIEPVDNVGTPIGSKASRYGEAVAKYIPAEIVSGYLPLSKLVSVTKADSVRTVLEWSLFAAGVVLTPLYLKRFYKPSNAQMRQVWISTIAFVFWAAALGGPFAQVALLKEHDYLAGFLLGAFTWIVGCFPPRAPVRVVRGVRT